MEICKVRQNKEGSKVVTIPKESFIVKGDYVMIEKIDGEDYIALKNQLKEVDDD